MSARRKVHLDDVPREQLEVMRAEVHDRLRAQAADLARLLRTRDPEEPEHDAIHRLVLLMATVVEAEPMDEEPGSSGRPQEPTPGGDA